MVENIIFFLVVVYFIDKGYVGFFIVWIDFMVVFVCNQEGWFDVVGCLCYQVCSIGGCDGQ